MLPVSLLALLFPCLPATFTFCVNPPPPVSPASLPGPGRLPCDSVCPVSPMLPRRTPRSSFLLLLLVSASWLFGLLAVNHSVLAFHYLHAGLCGLQVSLRPVPGLTALQASPGRVLAGTLLPPHPGSWPPASWPP